MGKQDKLRKELLAVLTDPVRAATFVVERSNLPGSRASLDLAAAFADLVSEGLVEPAWDEHLLRWAGIPAEEAPTQDPRELLPFVAVQALGSRLNDAPDEERDRIAEALRAAANDSRWRVREAAAFALQRVGARSTERLEALLRTWMTEPSVLEMRAVLAGLAHPPLLESPAMTDLAFELADDVFERSFDLPSDMRGSTSGKALVKALGFAPSVFVAACPDRGFAWLARWADHGSIEGAKIVAANLRKARLARHFPDQVEETALRLDAALSV